MKTERVIQEFSLPFFSLNNIYLVDNFEKKKKRKKQKRSSGGMDNMVASSLMLIGIIPSPCCLTMIKGLVLAFLYEYY